MLAFLRECVVFYVKLTMPYRAVKRVTRPRLGFTSFDAAQRTLAGIERMHMSKKRQLVVEAGEKGALPPSSSTLLPPHPPAMGSNSPQSVYTRTIAREPGREHSSYRPYPPC